MPLSNIVNKMIWVQLSTFTLMLLVNVATTRSFTPDFLSVDSAPVNQIANITYGVENPNQGSLTSIFSPRMDFEQWKPLTGKGDPLRNDPTYDYEPPVLDRVHYWADDTRLERERFPERKSEVLMLGVSSRKPSVTSRQPPVPPRRYINRPLPNKYEDFTFKVNDHYPMTILVPPPPPPPGHKPALFVLSDDKIPITNQIQSQIVSSSSNPPKVAITDSTTPPEYLSSFYALQESNLIYQSSTTHNWITPNVTKPVANNAVSSDYAGWGPTTPLDDSDSANETYNFISNDHIEFSSHPYSFYKPMLSEAPPPPPPKKISNSLILPTFLPTVLPPTTVLKTSTSVTQVTWPTEHTTEVQDLPTETTPEETTETNNIILFTKTPTPTFVTKSQTSMLDMLKPMMSMPMVDGPERPEDTLYAHASESIQVFNKHNIEDIQIETMQTMQPPQKHSESSSITNIQQFHVNSQPSINNPSLYTHGPYLHGHFTTPIATTVDEIAENIKSTTEIPAVPMYSIIQGHSKVKTYGSIPKVPEPKDTISNEISKIIISNEVKHLHPITKKSAKKLNIPDTNRKGKAKNLKTLIDSGRGSIELQETNLGIKYDVSDGSYVPVEIYRKGIVDNDDNGYPKFKKQSGGIRTKRQIDLEDLLPFDEDDIEEYVYNYLEGKKNETGITGLIAQAVTSDAASAVDEIEDEDDILDEER